MPEFEPSSPTAKMGLGIANIKAFGARTDGVTNDGPAILAAIASGVGSIILPPGITAFRGNIVIPNGVCIQGSASGNGINKCKLLCLDATSRIIYGDTVGGTPNSGGISGNYSLDGNGTGNPNGLEYHYITVGRTFQSIFIQNGGGDNLLVEGSQNDRWYSVQSQNCVGDTVVFDKGTQNCLISGYEFNLFGSSGIHIKSGASVVAGAQPGASGYLFSRGICEVGLAGSYASIFVEAGIDNLFDQTQGIAATSANVSGAALVIKGTASVVLRDSDFEGGTVNDAIYLNGAAQLTIEGFTRLTGIHAVTIDGAGPFGNILGNCQPVVVTSFWNPVNGGSTANFLNINNQYSGSFLTQQTNGLSWYNMVRLIGDVGARAQYNFDGTITYMNGANFTQFGKVGMSGTSYAIVVGGVTVTINTAGTIATPGNISCGLNVSKAYTNALAAFTTINPTTAVAFIPRVNNDCEITFITGASTTLTLGVTTGAENSPYTVAIPTGVAVKQTVPANWSVIITSTTMPTVKAMDVG